MKIFKAPVLTHCFRLAGIIVIAAGLAMAVIMMMGAGPARQVSAALGIPAIYVALICLLMALIVALPFFAMAQVVEYLDRTAYYAKLISVNLESEAYETRKDLQKLAAQLNVIAENQSKHAAPGVPPLPAAGPSVNCPYCSEAILLGTLRKGVNTCPKCAGNFNAE